MTISRALSKLGLPRKKKVPRAQEQDSPEVQEQRREFCEGLADLDPRRLVFVDECGANTAMTRTHGRAPVGQRVDSNTPGRWESITLTCGLRLSGVTAALAFPGATNTVEAAVESGPDADRGDVLEGQGGDEIGDGAFLNSGAREPVQRSRDSGQFWTVLLHWNTVQISLVDAFRDSGAIHVSISQSRHGIFFERRRREEPFEAGGVRVSPPSLIFLRRRIMSSTAKDQTPSVDPKTTQSDKAAETKELSDKEIQDPAPAGLNPQPLPPGAKKT